MTPLPSFYFTPPRCGSRGCGAARRHRWAQGSSPRTRGRTASPRRCASWGGSNARCSPSTGWKIENCGVRPARSSTKANRATASRGPSSSIAWARSATAPTEPATPRFRAEPSRHRNHPVEYAIPRARHCRSAPGRVCSGPATRSPIPARLGTCEPHRGLHLERRETGHGKL